MNTDDTDASESHIWQPYRPGHSDEASGVAADDSDFRETVTLMVYMIGSDLESSASAATSDMEEIAHSGIDTDQVNVLVYTGGASEWHSDVPADANALFLLEDGGFRMLETYEQSSMGEPAGLTRFLQYGYDQYPADSYSLILWNHGNGPVMGYGSDKLFGGDALTLPEMRQALEDSPFGAAEVSDSTEKKGNASGSLKTGQKLSFIGFDACLMASAELVCTVADYADYLVASQETEPSFGWNYAFLENLGWESSESLTTQIVDDYIAFCEDYFKDKAFFQSDVTLAAIDLSRAAELGEAIDALFAAAQDDVSGDFNKLAVARVHAHGLGRASTGSEYDLVDLESLLTEMGTRYPKETEAVRSVLQRSVVRSGANIENCCGLSLFYPYYNKNYYEAQWKEAYASLDLFPHYLSYLKRYEQIWLGTDLKEAFTEEMKPVKGDKPAVYQMQLSEEQYEQYAKGAYYIMRRRSEELYAPVYMSTNVTDANGLLTAEFNGNVIYAADDYGFHEIPVTRVWDTQDGVTDYSVVGTRIFRGYYTEEESVACDIQISVNEETGELIVKGIYESDSEEDLTGGKKQPVDPAEWDKLTLYNARERYLTRNEEGAIINFWDWPEGDWGTWNEVSFDNGFRFAYEPLYDDGEEYFIMFDVQDVQGNHYESELLPVVLEEAPDFGGDQTSVRTLQLDENNEVVLLEESGIKLEMALVRDVAGGKDFYAVTATNENEFAVRIEMEKVFVNDGLSIPESVYITLEAGETGYDTLRTISEYCRFAGIDRVSSLDFVMEADNRNSGAYLVHRQPVRLLTDEEAEAKPVVLPFLETAAERQVLTKAEDVQITLLTCGLPLETTTDLLSEYAEMKLDFRAENHSDREKSVEIIGAEFNGVFFRIDSQTMLPAGDTWYTSTAFSKRKLTGLVQTTFDDRPERMTSISSIRVLTAVDGVLQWCPVTLSEAGTEPLIEPSGTVLYEDERIRLCLYDASGEVASEDQPGDSGTGEEESNSYTPTIESTSWDIWFINKSEEVLMANILQEGYEPPEYLAVSEIGPGSAQLVEAIVYQPTEELDPSGIRVYSQIRDTRRRDYTESEVFTIPLP